VDDVTRDGCRNLPAEPFPQDGRLPLVIVGAHYDSVPGSPGADDNASAVAALLELAAQVGPRLASLGPCRARLQLAAYDLEEYGLVGSGLHSRALRAAGAAVRGMVSLAMVVPLTGRPGFAYASGALNAGASHQAPPLLCR
jgi:Zn-dependent M28 family amino/carboxypeptidase